MYRKRVAYVEIQQPSKDSDIPVLLTMETMRERKNKVLKKMEERNLDKLVMYCDVEHGWNFAYLVGFYTRFEEALLILDKSGKAVLMLGNENLNKAQKSRITADAVHVSLFSLPNQPHVRDKPFIELLKEAGIDKDQKIGMVGWKHFTSVIEDNEVMMDIPSFITKGIEEIVGNPKKITNETSIFIGEDGVRTTNNANEIAHYEYGASLASDCILDAMDEICEGKTELDIADKPVRYGQHTTVTTIASSGERFIDGNMFPINHTIQIGEPISMTVGYVGGSSSRSGYVVHDESELHGTTKDYLEKMAFPYFNAYVEWLKTVGIGKQGMEIFNHIENVFPRERFHWSLCPGHLVADEEWMCSLIYENSKEVLRSGMIFQIDIIPSSKYMGGISAESTIVLADQDLKDNIKKEYPNMWERMQKRIRYIKEVLHIDLSDDILPMCSSVAYVRPYLLDKQKALIMK